MNEGRKETEIKRNRDGKKKGRKEAMKEGRRE